MIISGEEQNPLKCLSSFGAIWKGINLILGLLYPLLCSLAIHATKPEEAHLALESFDTKWSKQYPQIAKSWYANWDNLMIFLQYPAPIRRVIYTTNAVESVNSQLRKVTKNKRVFPNDESVFKMLYLSTTSS